MILSEALSALTKALRPIANTEAALEARLILAHILSIPAGMLPLRSGEAMSAAQEEQLSEILSRRLKHEPLQYIVGEWDFMGLPFYVRQGALIPRPDTEILAENAIALARERHYSTALDMCCGTGCIGISLAKLGGLQVTASDISPFCIALTKENAARNGVQLHALTGSYFEPVTGAYDLIVCNPPYIRASDFGALQQEVRYEPRLALYGGEDGLDAYRILAAQYRKYLREGGAMLLEVGIGQTADVAELLGTDTEFFYDYGGVARVVCAGA